MPLSLLSLCIGVEISASCFPSCSFLVCPPRSCCFDILSSFHSNKPPPCYWYHSSITRGFLHKWRAWFLNGKKQNASVGSSTQCFAWKVLDCELLECQFMAQSNNLLGELCRTRVGGQWRAWVVETITVRHRRSGLNLSREIPLNPYPVHPWSPFHLFPRSCGSVNNARRDM